MDTDVIIVGAGPAGLCLARALAVLGLRIDILERQPAASIANPAFDGREIALTHGSMRILRGLGVWQHIPGHEVAPLRMARVMDGSSGAGFKVDAGQSGHAQLGSLVANDLIRSAAWKEACGSASIRTHAGVTATGVATDEAGARVQLADGHVLQGRLLVAADSRFSETRRAMGIAVESHDFGRTMLVCRMSHDEPHHGTAWEWFGRGQTRALLPLREERLSSVVLTVTGSEATRLCALPPTEFARAVETRFEHRLGSMVLASSLHAYPLVATWARRFVAPRFALIGDAAVGMHPVTAHGFNLGLASVERLAHAVGDSLAQHGDPAHPALLARYQHRHRAGSLPLYLGTRAVVGLFTDDRRRMQPLRRAILRAGAAMSPLRRALAAGLIDEGPLDLPLAQRMWRGLQRLAS
ncbi:5-demethoxyubiquinol-8 5-hydroxylase UbiM [Marilutibacter alkalisoli]|uniref:5-demethoxyubiquinol-8 5-hydroxylase UbiM n=1 Tax=Marilutibacter alkalisoli TaxID=2591633 RepID=A0A514BSG4_9GAMM|nr:5-demethoxyubiquinol-8 5-hydroxylase UbiM [Lysobacter alkalisoli]QDH70321.1 5-demethoxyubiquinol-8 5-hydroxylase UbiM [Lysobacter alkalisoli]